MLRLHKERSQNTTQENPVFQNAIGKLVAWASSSAPTIRYTYRQAKTIELHHYRTVLQWEPHIEIKAKEQSTMRFYTGDSAGKYTVKVEGMTNDGRPVRGQYTFDIKEN